MSQNLRIIRRIRFGGCYKTPVCDQFLAGPLRCEGTVLDLGAPALMGGPKLGALPATWEPVISNRILVLTRGRRPRWVTRGHPLRRPKLGDTGGRQLGSQRQMERRPPPFSRPAGIRRCVCVRINTCDERVLSVHAGRVHNNNTTAIREQTTTIRERGREREGVRGERER